MRRIILPSHDGTRVALFPSQYRESRRRKKNLQLPRFYFRKAISLGDRENVIVSLWMKAEIKNGEDMGIKLALCTFLHSLLLAGISHVDLTTFMKFGFNNSTPVQMSSFFFKNFFESSSEELSLSLSLIFGPRHWPFFAFGSFWVSPFV